LTQLIESLSLKSLTHLIESLSPKSLTRHIESMSLKSLTQLIELLAVKSLTQLIESLTANQIIDTRTRSFKYIIEFVVSSIIWQFAIVMLYIFFISPRR